MPGAGGFGRKGLNNGPQARPDIRSGGFGRAGTPAAPQASTPPSSLEEFRAAEHERARRRMFDDIRYHTVDSAEYPAAVDDLNRQQHFHAPGGKRKSLLLAYVYWYFAGLISAHRFYLGDTRMAIMQCSGFVAGLAVLWLFGVVLKFQPFAMLGIAIMGATFLWVLVDMFLIPGICRRANDDAPGVRDVFR